MNKNQVKIFISYAWESEIHNDKVISFCDSLRKDYGYIAEMDRLLSQQQSSIHFSEMMHKGIANNDKVIIVLSPKYKKKAEAFLGGVGEEYRLIITEISTNPNKYILVSFDGINDELIPLGLKGRKIIDFSNSYSETWNQLIATIQNEPEIEFSEVSKKRVSVNKRAIRSFEEILKEKNFQEKPNDEVFFDDRQIIFTESNEEIIKATNIFQFVCHYKSEYVLKYNISGRPNILGLDTIYNQEEFQKRLRITILENKGGWNIKKTFIIKNGETETYCSFDVKDFKIIDNQVFIVFETSSAGTFFNGMQTYNFCLFNLFSNSYEILKYFYVSGDFVGEYTNVEEVSEQTQKIVFPLAVNFLENIGIGKEDDIDENSFPHIQWIANNPTIYEDMRDNKDSYYDTKISFTPINKDKIPKLSDFEGDLEAYTSSISILETNKYIVYGGFAALIIGVNKSTNDNFIIFVPEGFPSGGSWGARSFEILSLNENILIIQDYLYKLTIDLSNGYFNIGESTLFDDADSSANQKYNLKEFFKNILSIKIR